MAVALEGVGEGGELVVVGLRSILDPGLRRDDDGGVFAVLGWGRSSIAAMDQSYWFGVSGRYWLEHRSLQ